MVVSQKIFYQKILPKLLWKVPVLIYTTGRGGSTCLPACLHACLSACMPSCLLVCLLSVRRFQAMNISIYISHSLREMNLEMAALISDSVVDEVIESLSETHKTLVGVCLSVSLSACLSVFCLYVYLPVCRSSCSYC